MEDFINENLWGVNLPNFLDVKQTIDKDSRISYTADRTANNIPTKNSRAENTS
jgi:hypothetical protein